LPFSFSSFRRIFRSLCFSPSALYTLKVEKVFSFFSDKILHQQKKQAASKAGEEVGIPGSIMPGDSSLLL
jgi:hypothetical protein